MANGPNDPFAAIIGQDRACDLLRRALDTGRVAHAYLMIGPAGVGKTTVIEAFAGVLLGMPPAKSADWRVWLPEGRQLKIAQSREVITACTTPPLGAGYQVFVVHGAETMVRDSGHALLKTLEEPPPRTVLILTAERADAVMATIRSRTQLVPFGLVAEPVIAAALEARGVAPERAALLARESEGRIGMAIGRIDAEPVPDRWPAVSLRTAAGRVEAAKALGELSPADLRTVLAERVRRLHQGEGAGWDELTVVDRALRRLDANVNAKLVLESLLHESVGC